MADKYFRSDTKFAKDDDTLSREVKTLREHLIRAERSGFFEPDVAVFLAEFKRAAKNLGLLYGCYR